MAKTKSKRTQKRSELVDRAKQYSIKDAVGVLKAIADNKYDESISVNTQLGIRPDQSDEMVRGTVVLPHGSGKKLFIVCIASGNAATEAKEAGADEVGGEELIKKISGGWFEFDAIVAHPDMMREVSKLGRVLGPRGLMPSPKAGTVTPKVGQAVQELKAGKIEFKNDKTGGVHAICGKLSFSDEALTENLQTLLRAIRDAKPASSKGDYFKKITIAPSQGPGIPVAANSI